MDRTLSYIVPADCAGIRISQFLRRKGFSRQNLIELKKQDENTKLNGKPAFGTQKIAGGDCITVHIHEAETSPILPVNLPIEILYEDEDLLVVNKPAGMPTHPSIKNTDNTLGNALAFYFQQQNKTFVFRCTNRLDQDTSGLTVVAKHFVSGNMLSEMGVRREIHRNYLAIVKGEVIPPQGTIDAPIARAEDSIIARKIDFEHGDRAVTHYQVLKTENGHSLVSLVLETGRTHQIRLHMKHIGFPLIGDHLYNPDMALISRQALHSASLSFRHPITGEEMHFVAPLPDDMAAIISYE